MIRIINYYQGNLYQRGYGFGGIFRSLFRAAVPLFKSGAKAVGKQLLNSGMSLMGDISQGQNFKMAAKRRLKEAGNNLADKASTKVKNMIGSGRRKKMNKKRKRVVKRDTSRKNKKVKAHRDIFS